MTTRDEPLDPQEVLAAAEAAHLAARRTVPISRRPSRPAADRPAADRPASDRPALDRPALDRPATDPASSGRPTVLLPPAGTRGSGPGALPGAGAGSVRATVRLSPRPAPAAVAGRSRAPLPVAGAVAAGWAALLSFLPVAVLLMVLQAAENRPFAVLAPARLAAAGWLLGHGVPLHTPAGTVGLVPLLLTGFAAWRVARAGVHVTRTRGATGRGSLRQALLAAGAVAVAYGGIGMLAAAFVGGPGWGVSVPRSGLTLAGFGFLAAGYGSVRATGVLAAWTVRTPAVLRDGFRAGLVGAGGVLAAGAALAGIAVAAGGGAAADILAAYRTNVAGQAGLTMLCLVYAPNLAGWAAAYLVGPGFAVGTDSVVRSSEVTLGWLPPLPVFAGLPDGPLPTVGAVLLVVPIAAGATCGWLLARWAPGWGPAAVATVVSGVVAGGLLGLAAVASGGPLGDGQLASFGPDPLLVAGFSAVTLTAGAVLGMAVTAVATNRRGSRPQ